MLCGERCSTRSKKAVSATKGLGGRSCCPEGTGAKGFNPREHVSLERAALKGRKIKD